MPNPGNRKQRYVLDIDDVVKDGFMTKDNAEALIRGINGSGGMVKLAVPFGGTNNGVFTDQELVKYDAATGKIVSAGFTGVLPGGNSIFIPRETGTLYSNSGVDTTTKSAAEMVIADQSFALPANSQWSDLMIVFQFAMNDLNPQVTGLEVRIGGDATPPIGFIQPAKPLLYQVGASPDNLSVTWIGMGQVPLSRAFDSPLQVRLYGSPQDITSYRSVITRASYRGLVPEPPTGGQKGVPVFIPPQIVYAGAGAYGWATFDATTYVPAEASAVIIYCFARSNEQGGGSRNVNYRTESGAGVFVIGAVQTNDDEDDIDTSLTQMILPFKSAGGMQSFQVQVESYTNGGVNIVLLGYIT